MVLKEVFFPSCGFMQVQVWTAALKEEAEENKPMFSYKRGPKGCYYLQGIFSIKPRKSQVQDLTQFLTGFFFSPPC